MSWYVHLISRFLQFTHKHRPDAHQYYEGQKRSTSFAETQTTMLAAISMMLRRGAVEQDTSAELRRLEVSLGLVAVQDPSPAVPGDSLYGNSPHKTDGYISISSGSESDVTSITPTDVDRSDMVLASPSPSRLTASTSSDGSVPSPSVRPGKMRCEYRSLCHISDLTRRPSVVCLHQISQPSGRDFLVGFAGASGWSLSPFFGETTRQMGRCVRLRDGLHLQAIRCIHHPAQAVLRRVCGAS